MLSFRKESDLPGTANTAQSSEATAASENTDAFPIWLHVIPVGISQEFLQGILRLDISLPASLPSLEFPSPTARTAPKVRHTMARTDPSETL